MNVWQVGQSPMMMDCLTWMENREGQEKDGKIQSALGRINFARNARRGPRLVKESSEQKQKRSKRRSSASVTRMGSNNCYSSPNRRRRFQPARQRKRQARRRVAVAAGSMSANISHMIPEPIQVHLYTAAAAPCHLPEYF